MDFAKAFDKVKVPQRKLIHKLNFSDITQGITYRWFFFKNYNRPQLVVLGGTCSDPAPVVYGIPQGLVLRLVLFLLLSYDLLSGISSTVHLLQTAVSYIVMYTPILVV